MMRILAASLRRPAPQVGSLIALTMCALIVVISASFIGTGEATVVPADRLAAASVVVTGSQNLVARVGTGANASLEQVPLTDYRRVPDGLARRLAAVPGVAAAVADESFPLALQLADGRAVTGSAAAPLTGHGWPSARLTPFRLMAGNAPAGAGQIAVGDGLARVAGLRVGAEVRLAGQDLPPLRVTGVVTDGRSDAASADSVFFTSAQAAALYGHCGQADLIGVIAAAGQRPAALAARIRSRLARAHYAVLTGTNRGQAENLSVATDDDNLEALGANAGIDVVLIAMLVVAGTVALSVSQRHHQFALLRAVGASPGQVRRGVLAELLALGLLGGLIGWLPGIGLASLGVHAMAADGLLPPTSVAWDSPWLLLIGSAAAIVVACLSGLVAARRAGRISPADALRESVADRRWPHPVRIVLGLAALGGSGVLAVVMARSGGGGNEVGAALGLLLALMMTVGLLGPLVASAAEMLVRLPVRAASVSGRLGVAEIRARPRRMASAIIPVAVSLAFAGTLYFLNTTLQHAAAIQGRQRLVATQVVTAPGPGLEPAALPAIAGRAGVRAAVGITPAQITVADPDLDAINGEVISGGQLSSVLSLNVSSGSVRDFGPGDIAVSQQEAESGVMGVHVGQRVTVYLPDGAPYRARVSAIYSRSIGFADVLLPSSAAAGHLESDALGEVLVRGTGRAGRALAGLGSEFPGLRSATRQATDMQAEQAQSQNDLVDNMILAVIVLLASVTLVNTLVLATIERRRSLLLLSQVGATRRQLLSVTAWQAGLVGVTGVTLGGAISGVALTAMARGITGSWPYVPLPAAIMITGTVLALTAVAALGSTWVLAGSKTARRSGL